VIFLKPLSTKECRLQNLALQAFSFKKIEIIFLKIFYTMPVNAEFLKFFLNQLMVFLSLNLCFY